VGFPGQISWRSGRPELQLQGLPQAVCNWLMVQGA